MSKHRFVAVAMALALTVVVSVVGVAQDKSTISPTLAQTNPAIAGDLPNQVPQPEIYHPKGTIVVPESSVLRPEDAGLRAHTNVVIFVPEGKPVSSPLPYNTFAETPQSLACVYKNGVSYAGCTPSGGTGLYPAGGWGAVVLVDAFHNPNSTTDLATFSSHFGLPAAAFRRVYANSSFGTLNGMTASCSGVPPGNTGWGLEEDLDIEYAHAMSPNAVVVLVEACSNSNSDLFFAEQVAGIEAVHYGGGDISNSWGEGEFSGEIGTVDDVFYRYYWNQIAYFASAGDSGWGAQYPSSSPWVVSVGGTTINRDSSGNFLNESCWSGSGGGVSQYETWQNPPDITNGMGPWTNYQYAFAGENPRQTPDIAADADPNSGAMVYDTYGYSGWIVVGGTSLASPLVAGIVNISNNRLGQAPTGGGNYTNEENNLIYGQLYSHAAYAQDFTDITTGSNGTGHNAGPGYDQCTGVGTPRGHTAK